MFIFRAVDHSNGPMASLFSKRGLAIQKQEFIFLAPRGETTRPMSLSWPRGRSSVPQGASHSCPAITLPRYVEKPTSTASFLAPAFAGELPDVDHAVRGHISVSRVADVGVVLPDDAPRVWAVEIREPLERFLHVAVADVPGFGATPTIAR